MKILVISPNWLGDFIMALPAFHTWRASLPAEASVTILTKPALAALWRCVRGADEVRTLPPGTKGTFQTGFALRKEHFRSAYILPNSFRSALIAFLAAIPERFGTAFHARALLINRPIRFSTGEKALHQQFEYAKIFFGSVPEASRLHPDCASTSSPCGFNPPPTEILHRQKGFSDPLVRCIGIIPGAARGDSKRWPFFAEAAARIAKELPFIRFCVLGSQNERELCESVSKTLGDRAVCLAGETSLPEFASVLSSCACVLCNDSGGMHLASASGVPVVAVFGLTDPRKTGPIGKNAVILQPSGVRASRAIKRTDPDAAAALRRISPEQVAAAAISILSSTNHE